jgi:hypothetical protein
MSKRKNQLFQIYTLCILSLNVEVGAFLNRIPAIELVVYTELSDSALVSPTS